MTDETLISLAALEEQTEASSEMGGFSLAIVERELILCCAFILTAPEQILGHAEGIYVHPETATDRYNQLFRHYFSHSDKRNRSYLHRLPDPYLGEEQIPDVCGWCFRTLGFCAGGRLRFRCKDCYNKKDPISNSPAYISRCYYPHRICYDHSAIEAIFAQLIYKYFSPNGDRTWEMKTVLKS